MNLSSIAVQIRLPNWLTIRTILHHTMLMGLTFPPRIHIPAQLRILRKDISGDDDDCCNDLTTAFFSVFQVQPHTFVADQPVPVDHHPVIVVKNIFNSYVVDPSLIYPGFDTPMKIAFTGRHLRILYQSFLN